MEQFKKQVHDNIQIMSPVQFGAWYKAELPKYVQYFNNPDFEQIHLRAVQYIDQVMLKEFKPVLNVSVIGQRELQEDVHTNIHFGEYVQLPAEMFPLIKAAKTVLTFDQFDSFCYFTNTNLPNDQGFGRGSRPAINLHVIDTIRYVNWINDMQGKPMPYILKKYNEAWWFWYNPEIRGHAVYVFPSKDEWYQIAADHAENLDTRTDLHEIAWSASEMDNTTQPTCMKKPNKYGIYDTVGNVWKMAVPNELPFMSKEIWAEKFPNEPYLSGIYFYKDVHIW